MKLDVVAPGPDRRLFEYTGALQVTITDDGIIS